MADQGCLSWIPDPAFFNPGSLIRTVSIPDPGSSSKYLSILTPKKAKKWFLSSKEYDPGCSSRIPDPGSGCWLSPIPDPGSRGQKGTQSRIPDPDPQHCPPPSRPGVVLRIHIHLIKSRSRFLMHPNYTLYLFQKQLKKTTPFRDHFFYWLRAQVRSLDWSFDTFPLYGFQDTCSITHLPVYLFYNFVSFFSLSF